MNLAGAQAWILAHKGVVAGGAGVAGLALVMRSRKGTTAASTAIGSTPATVAQPATADTSAYDTYNALNDQLTSWESSVQAQIDGLTSSGGNTAPTPADTAPAPTPAPAPSTTPSPAPAAPAPQPASGGTYVSAGNQFVNGAYVGPAGVPYYTQAQWNAMSSAQQSNISRGPYTLLTGPLANANLPPYAPAASPAPAVTAAVAGYPSITRTAVPTTPIASTASVVSAPIRASATPTLASTGSIGALQAAWLAR